MPCYNNVSQLKKIVMNISFPYEKSIQDDNVISVSFNTPLKIQVLKSRHGQSREIIDKTEEYFKS